MHDVVFSGWRIESDVEVVVLMLSNLISLIIESFAPHL
jgi:hypothetical protein